MGDSKVRIEYFSDVLCIWAYVAEARVHELRRNFADQVQLSYRFVPVFGSVRSKLERQWAPKGGLEWYSAHVAEVANQFEHVEVNPEVWKRDVPAGSLSPHLFLCAAGLLVAEGKIDDERRDDCGGRTPFEQLAWRLRQTFFVDADNISRLDVQLKVAAELGLDTEAIRQKIDDGSAAAALAEDHELANRHQVTGSPTFLLNEGRQKLYGNVGYRIVEANLQELLRDHGDRASWC